MDNSRAILLMTIAMAAFAVTDALIKEAAGAIGAMQCLLLTSVLSLAAFLPLVWKNGDRLFSRKALSPPMLVRTFGEIIGAGGVVSALAILPLSLVVALLQAQPLALTAAAAIFLKETVGWRRWSAVSVGFVGMMVILRPGAEGFDVALLLPLLGVVGLTLRDLGTRLLPPDISTPLAASWALIAVGTVGGLGTFAGSGWTEMNAGMWGIVVAASITVAAAYWTITAALRLGEISAVAPFRYTRIIFAMLIAWFFLGERPDLWVWAGLAIIIASGLYSFWRERQIARNVSA